MESICRIYTPIDCSWPVWCCYFQGDKTSHSFTWQAVLCRILYIFPHTFQEVDEPLQLDMSELSLNDDFAQRSAGKLHCVLLTTHISFVSTFMP